MRRTPAWDCPRFADWDRTPLPPREVRQPPAALPKGPQATPEAAPPRLGAVSRDEAAIARQATAITTGGKPALQAYTPDDDEPAPERPTFTSNELGEGAPAIKRPDFEVQAAWKETSLGLRAASVSVRTSAGGPTVTVGADGGVALDGRPLALVEEEPHALPGGGSVTYMGGGYVSIRSAAGDDVATFTRGGRVDFYGQLAGAQG
ncbi:MAG: hypothetical protein JWM80_4653 [Cyanobacteria bacterium RYN_339]|nr:hypothetical protein [Cyanobacteria bacterium RYN_339]